MAQWSNNAKILLEARYLKKDREGKLIETPDQLLERVAKSIAEAEKNKNKAYWSEKFLEILDDLYFLPNTPTLVNAGNELGQLSACFVLPVEDQIEAIFEVVKQSAVIHKTGGGTGFNFSKLRPKGWRVGSTSGVASGPVSFMYAFNAVTETIKQGGIRRGANIGILNCNHPDIQEFINCKRNTTAFNNFNISVSLTDSFLNIVTTDREWELYYRGERIEIKAKDLFHMICENAWATGEPGVIFIDTINKYNPTPWLGRIESTNPCGEQPLLAWESCNLGSIDLSKFTNGTKTDYNKLEEVVKIAVRFLDDVIDVNKYPRVKIERKTKITRKIGLGVMGWADLLIKMGIRYDSKEALKLAREIMQIIKSTAKEESQRIGQEKGFFNERIKRRNATLTTIAPTGSISILADCSSGIEPIYDIKYGKKILDGVILDLGAKYSNYPKELLIVARDISPEFHVTMQATFQKYIDNAVSKTINMPKSATVEDVKEAIIYAWENGCKGLTVYREGTREEAPLVSTEGLQFNECGIGKCEVI